MASESEKRETLAAIAEELRDEAARADTEQYYTLDDAAESMREYAERIEAIDSADAWQSLYAPGNATAMREACANIAEYARTARCHTDDAHVLGYLEQIEKWAESALSAPARQCDVGTALEQAQRFHDFCVGNSSGINGMCKSTCPCIDCFDKCQCLEKWAQMLYAAEEGAGDGNSK